MKPLKTPKTNDARRLFEFLTRASTLPSDTPAADGWLLAAGLPVEAVPEEEKVTIAYEVVADLRRLLDRTESKYGDVASSDEYKTVFSHFKVVANAQFVHGQWSSVQQHFAIGQHRIMMGVIADALPNDADAPGFESAKQLLKEVESLLNQINRSDLPPYHKHYAEMMLTRLRTSLRQYVMLGPQSAHEYSLFLHGLDAELAHKESDLKKEHADISEADQSLLEKVLEKTRKATELCKSVYYVGGASILAYQGVEKALPLLGRATASLPP